MPFIFTLAGSTFTQKGGGGEGYPLDRVKRRTHYPKRKTLGVMNFWLVVILGCAGR